LVAPFPRFVFDSCLQLCTNLSSVFSNGFLSFLQFSLQFLTDSPPLHFSPMVWPFLFPSLRRGFLSRSRGWAGPLRLRRPPIGLPSFLSCLEIELIHPSCFPGIIPEVLTGRHCFFPPFPPGPSRYTNFAIISPQLVREAATKSFFGAFDFTYTAFCLALRNVFFSRRLNPPLVTPPFSFSPLFPMHSSHAFRKFPRFQGRTKFDPFGHFPLLRSFSTAVR